MKKDVLPGQTLKVHFLACVVSPEHVSLPPERGLLHCRARNSVPGPQEAVHGVQAPHSSHTAGSSETEIIQVMKNFNKNTSPLHSDTRQFSVSVEFPSQAPRHPRARI